MVSTYLDETCWNPSQFHELFTMISARMIDIHEDWPAKPEIDEYGESVMENMGMNRDHQERIWPRGILQLRSRRDNSHSGVTSCFRSFQRSD